MTPEGVLWPPHAYRHTYTHPHMHEHLRTMRTRPPESIQL